MNDEQFKQIVYREIAGVVSALGEPRRLEILEILSQCERNVESLAQVLGAGITTVSHHLQVLKRARLVEERRQGRFAYYSTTATALRLWDLISEIAAHELAVVRCAMDDIFSDSTSRETVDYEELVRRVAVGEAVVIDVRPEEEYAAGHVPGALSVSLERLTDKVGELPRDTPILAYCRGRYCVLSHEATRALAEKGYAVQRLSEGIAEWKAAGATLETINP